MSAKIILVFCAQALFVQSALSQCGCGLRAPWGLDDGYGWGYPWGLDGGYGLGLGDAGFGYAATSSGGLAVVSGSPIAPTGLSVLSENVFGGELASAGELPFVGTVDLEGVLPTAGAGAVNHHCGDGINAIASDGFDYGGAYGLGYGSAYGLGYGGILDRGYGLGWGAGLGYRGGWARRGCGCGIY